MKIEDPLEARVKKESPTIADENAWGETASSDVIDGWNVLGSEKWIRLHCFDLHLGMVKNIWVAPPAMNVVELLQTFLRSIGMA
jgi:hypothetical protein